MRRRATVVAVALVAASLAGGVRAADESPAAMALEVDLAQKPDLYLVLDPGAKRLSVRARGVDLTTVDLVEVSRLVFRPLFGGKEPPPLELPAVWTVLQGPGDTDRETIAPTTLRPYKGSDDEEESPSSNADKKKPAGEEETTPSTFRVQLDVGWQLFLANEPPRLGLLRRFSAAVKDGWLKLRGEEPSHPPLVTLVVAPDDARRLHHLFRSGMPILVLAGG